jgi:ferritin-like protein
MGKTSRKNIKIEANMLAEELNRALADEWFAIYQHWFASLAPEQIMSLVVMEVFEETLKDEREHAEELASRILELKGRPIDNPNQWEKLAHYKYTTPPKDLTDLKRFLGDALKGAICAMETYNKIAEMGSVNSSVDL